MAKTDPEILQMALVGYSRELRNVEAKIVEIQRLLKRGVKMSAAPLTSGRRKRKISAQGIKAIREAVKKRWAEFHKLQAEAAQAVSPELKQKRLAALAKARQAKAEKKAAAQSTPATFPEVPSAIM